VAACACSAEGRVAVTDEHAALVGIDPALAAALMDNSPRLYVTRPALIRHHDSPTGWLVVIPSLPDPFFPLET
jgi:hypothetical protein